MKCIKCKKEVKNKIKGLCKNCYNKKLYKENPIYRQKAKQNAKIWKIKNPDKNYMYTKNWINKHRTHYNYMIMDNYYKNKEKWSARQKIYYNNNKEKCLAYAKKYKMEHKTLNKVEI